MLETDAPACCAISGRLPACADLETLERSLSQWRDAGPRRIDLTAAGEFDIGPAWSDSHGICSEAAAQGMDVVRGGDLPAHSAYLDELAGADQHATTRRRTKPAATRGWSRFGRAIEARGQ